MFSLTWYWRGSVFRGHNNRPSRENIAIIIRIAGNIPLGALIVDVKMSSTKENYPSFL